MKKVFSILALVMFMSSSLNANSIREEVKTNETVDCYDQVYMVTVMADVAGYSIEEVQWFSQVALAIYCYGYSLGDF